MSSTTTPSRTPRPRGRIAAARDARARAWNRVRTAPRELLALLAIAATLSLTWSVAVAPFQGPDEITHVSYVQQLAETGEGPSFLPIGYAVSTEIGRALDTLNLRSIIGVPTARGARSEIEERFWRASAERLTEQQRADGIGPSPLARNPQLYYAYEAVPYFALQRADLFDRVMAMRLFNVALFVLTVLLTWLLATEVFGRERRLEVVVATGIVALWPMLTFMGGVVNPDTGLTTAYTLVALLGVRLVGRGPALGRIAALCVAAAACMLVHGRGAPAAGVAAVAILAAAIVHRPQPRRLAGWSVAGAALAAVPLLVARLALPNASGGGLYGGEANLGQSFNVKQLIGQTWQFYFDRLWFMQPRLGPDYGYRQLFVERWVTGVFGGLEITYPTWVYDVAQLAIAGFVALVWTAAVVHRDRVRRAWPVLAVLGALAAGLMLLLHTASYRALVTGPDPLITGRYLLPLTPLAALAIAWLAGAAPARLRGYAAGGVLATLLLLQLGGLGMTIVRFHA